jgi:hypothetical protein
MSDKETKEQKQARKQLKKAEKAKAKEQKQARKQLKKTEKSIAKLISAVKSSVQYAGEQMIKSGADLVEQMKEKAKK